ncbi:MAG TPA: ABC transporter ATP-binding protein [Kiloniellales bacterium]
MSLKAENLHAGYVSDIDILSGLTVEARSRQLTTVVGANGVGKSTLLKCIVGQIRPHSGSITYEGREITGIASNQLVRLGIAYIAQRRNIFPHLTVRENLEMGAWIFRRDRPRVADAMERALEAAPFLREFQARRAGDLSGGQQRLLEIQRALITDPKLLLVDEPTVGLDPKITSVIYDHLRRLCTEEGRTILMVDQNVMAGTAVADYIYVVELGANKIEGAKADFDAKYRDSIAEWLL